MKRKQPVKKKKAFTAKRTKVVKKAQRRVQGGVTVTAPMRIPDLRYPEGSGEYIMVPGMIWGHPRGASGTSANLPIIIGFGKIQFPE